MSIVINIRKKKKMEFHCVVVGKKKKQDQNL